MNGFVVLLVGLALLLGATTSAAQSRLYRYTNAQGQLEISHAIPTDRVAAGYEVIDSSTGQVIRVVAPQLTPEQLAAKQRREREAAICNQEMERLRALYGREQDITHASDQAVASLQGRIEQIRANLLIEQRRLEEFQLDAAQLERSGNSVPTRLLNNMKRTEAQVATLEREILQRHAEQDQARSRFQADLELYRQGECVVPEHRS